MKKTSSGRSGRKYTTSSELAGMLLTASYSGSPATQSWQRHSTQSNPRSVLSWHFPRYERAISFRNSPFFLVHLWCVALSAKLDLSSIYHKLGHVYRKEKWAVLLKVGSIFKRLFFWIHVYEACMLIKIFRSSTFIIQEPLTFDLGADEIHLIAVCGGGAQESNPITVTHATSVHLCNLVVTAETVPNLQHA